MPLQRALQEADAAIAHAKRALAAHPNVPSVQATFRAILNHKASLKERLSTAGYEPYNEYKDIIETQDIYKSIIDRLKRKK